MSKSPTWAQAHRLQVELDLDRETAELLLRHPKEFAGFCEQLSLGSYQRLAVESFRYPGGNDFLRGLYTRCGYTIHDHSWSMATQNGQVAYLSGVSRVILATQLRMFAFWVTSRLAESAEPKVSEAAIVSIPEVRLCKPESHEITSLASFGGWGTLFDTDGSVRKCGELIGLDAALAIMAARQDLLSRERVLVVDHDTAMGVVWTIDWRGRPAPCLDTLSDRSVSGPNQNVQYAALKCETRTAIPSS